MTGEQDPPPNSASGNQERLQRILSSRGVASRRAAEVMITQGRVRVNGKVVTELGSKADTVKDTITVDGKRLPAIRLRYLVLNKPAGYITTTSDERERMTVMDLVRVSERVYPVGRLDRATEGLIILTNDGELSNRVMHPRYRIGKEYHVLVARRPSPQVMERVREGILLEGKYIVPDEFRIYRETSEGVWLAIVLHEGMNHVVRRLMEAATLDVLKLRRVRIGPVSVAGLPLGGWRDMTPGELASLEEAVRTARNKVQSDVEPLPNPPKRASDPD